MLGTVTARIALPKGAEVVVRRPRQATGGRRPSVSVVIPCYNYGRFLDACLQSVLDQQDVSVDIVIIDNASPDGSAAVVKRLAERDDRVRAIYHETNVGHIRSINEGLAQATGDYTVLLPADDLLTPGCLSRATSLMEAHPSVGMTYGFAPVCGVGELPPARSKAKSWVIWSGHSWIADRCRTGHNVLRGPEAVMRTSVLRETDAAYRPDLPLASDFEMWMRVATVSDIAYIYGADQAYYRIHDSNMHFAHELLGDMAQRLRAFDTIFAERGDLLMVADSLRSTAHRSLAVEALGYGISAYTRGVVAGQQPVDKYVTFAAETYPDVTQLRDWRILASLQAKGERAARHGLPLIVRERMLSARYALRWRRWRWAGVY